MNRESVAFGCGAVHFAVRCYVLDPTNRWVPCACFQAIHRPKPMDVHKGRTTRTPWDPVLVQKTIATSPASQAGSTGYCSRKYLGGAAQPSRERGGQPLEVDS